MKYNDYYKGRVSGMESALEMVKKGGVELLEDEVTKRRISGIDSHSYRLQIEEGQIDSIIHRALKYVFVVAVGCLHDEFGFGPGRMRRFADKFTEATELLARGTQNGALFTDFEREVEEVYGVTIKVRKNGLSVREKGKSEGETKSKAKGGAKDVRKA